MIVPQRFVANAWNMPFGIGSDVHSVYHNELAVGHDRAEIERCLNEERDVTCFMINDPEPVGCAGYFDIKTPTGPVAMAFFHINPGYKNKRAIVEAVRMGLSACPHSWIFASRDYNIESSGRFLRHFGFKEYPWLHSPLLLLLR